MRGQLGTLLLLLLLAPGALGQDTLAWADYRRELEALRTDWRAGRMDEVRRRARTLRSARLEHGGRVLRADPTVLDAFIGETNENSDTAERRLEALLAELNAAPAGATPPADRALLERIRREQALETWQRGGEVGGLPDVTPPSLSERLLAVRDRLREYLRAAWRWLMRLRFSGRQSQQTDSQQGLTTTVALVAIAVILIALLALYLRRRGAPATAGPTGGAPRPTSRDADPRSRSGDEWDRYARELATQGRLREALRAWFHAVLATLYRAGLLHYRRDRTNWEYAQALAADLAWRQGFVTLTEGFEAHWYGAHGLDEPALEGYAAATQNLLERIREARP